MRYVHRPRRLLIQGLLAAGTGAGAWPARAQQDALRIGYQKGASLFLLQKAQGTLENALGPLGFGVKWVEFPAGPQLLEGLNVGAIDVGYVGEAPLTSGTSARRHRSSPRRPAPGSSTSATTRPRRGPRQSSCRRILRSAPSQT